MIRVRESSYTSINRPVECPECGKADGIYIGTMVDSEEYCYCDNCDATFKASLVKADAQHWRINLDLVEKP